MDIIYKITYIPHINTEYPKYYIGSKKNYSNTRFYMGSVSSISIFDYTNNKCLKDWWKEKTKNRKEDFLFEIIEKYEDVSCSFLLEREKYIQEKYDVALNEEYFNQSIAITSRYSKENTEIIKTKKSIAAKKYWSSEKGKEKRKRLIERNKTVHKKVMKEIWKKPTEAMLSRNVSGRPKGAKDLRPRKQRVQSKIMVDGVIFDSAKEYSEKYDISVYSVRRRCSKKKYENWSYIK